VHIVVRGYLALKMGRHRHAAALRCRRGTIRAAARRVRGLGLFGRMRHAPVRKDVGAHGWRTFGCATGSPVAGRQAPSHWDRFIGRQKQASMADYEYNLLTLYKKSDGSKDGFLSTGGSDTLVLTDNEGGQTFSPDETLSFTLAGDTVSGDFQGTTEISGYTFVVVELANSYAFFGNITNADPSTLFNAFPDDIDEISLQDWAGDGFTVCFAPGTLISTVDGERPVETLTAGDRVRTADGRAVPVKWMGRQTMRRIATPQSRFCPVRIRAGALGEGLPHTDLVVTGDHGIMVDGVMVNAAALVNGTSIVRVPQNEVGETFVTWHVETEDHDVILANGTPAETFVDATTRRAFDNYDEYVAQFGEPEEPMLVLPHPRAFAARQLPARVRERIAARAEAIAPSAETEAA
jgi:hypothetical protein